MTIHASDPFATPEDDRSPVRRLRARLPAAVTVWTAYGRDDRPAGLTVSSTVVADGDPGHVLGIIDDESDLFEAVRESGRFVVMPLRESDSRLADMFAGLMPAPGGLFASESWTSTAWGPVLSTATTWAACRLTSVRGLGWGQLVEATVEQVEVGRLAESPLIHHRGRYLRHPSP